MASIRLEHQLRSLFVSDLHLGSKCAQPLALADLLCRVRVEHLYLVGDILDGWILAKRWEWKPEYERLIRLLLEIQQRGTQVHYLLGNHDRCLRPVIERWGIRTIAEKLIHRCIDGRRLLVIHGDEFDTVQDRHTSAARLAALFHEGVLSSSERLNALLGSVGFDRRPFGTLLTKPFKRLAQAYSGFEERLEESVKLHRCHGVVSGHVHTPGLRQCDELVFANTGDWLEHCTCMVETVSGQLELWGGSPRRWAAFEPRRLSLVPRLAASCGEAATVELVGA